MAFKTPRKEVFVEIVRTMEIVRRCILESDFIDPVFSENADFDGRDDYARTTRKTVRRSRWS